MRLSLSDVARCATVDEVSGTSCVLRVIGNKLGVHRRYRQAADANVIRGRRAVTSNRDTRRNVRDIVLGGSAAGREARLGRFPGCSQILYNWNFGSERKRGEPSHLIVGREVDRSVTPDNFPADLSPRLSPTFAHQGALISG
jgi:hypothetical protein